MGRYCRFLTLLILCSTAVSIVLLGRLWKLGLHVAAGRGSKGDVFGGKAGSVGGLFAGETRVTDLFEKEFRGQDRMPPSVETMDQKKTSHTGDPLLDYFLTMYLDGKEISWYSEVNNRGILMEALKDFMTMMLETDVQIKWDNDVKKTNGTAVIASKPNTEHDITLSDWLTIVAKFSNKGVKLNFGSTHSVMYGVPVLSNLRTLLHAPIWLHANILPGPNSNDFTVNHETFVKMISTSSQLPKLSLSLGWSTAWSPDPIQQRYSWQQVIAMAKVCATTKLPVSFSVRAVFAGKSTRQLKWLLSLASRFTVNIWADKYDIIPVAELVYVRQVMDPKKVFYDLPSSILDNIKQVSPGTKFSVSSDDKNGPVWNRNLWDPILINENSIAFLGKEQAVLDGSGSWLVSKVPYKPEMKTTRTIVVSGRVQFVDADTAAPSAGKSGVYIYIRSTGVNPPDPAEVQGMRLMISQDGSLMLSPSNLNQAGAYNMQSTAKLPTSDCYDFQLVDRGETYPIYCKVKLRQCGLHTVDGDGEAGTSQKASVELHMNVPYESEKQLFYVAVNGGSDKSAVIIDGLSVDERVITN
ncbi:uncharacterized protein LOC117304337 [Asterias rubens]|uniref:uncharacterized protein LOC117304337 n=1 Tax=Asterias rubens TaxID=7604 RepID=UPI00145504E5|nr:uncharacterized protein LOC117304337 [Asterias rubens]